MIQNKTVSVIGGGWLGKDLSLHLAAQGLLVYVSKTTLNGTQKLKKIGLNAVLFDANQHSHLPKELKNETIIITIPPSASKHQPYCAIISSIVNELNKSETKKVILTSSTGVYLQESGTFNEDSKTDNSERAERLLLAEELILNSEFDCCVLRLGGLSGTDRHPGTRDAPTNLATNETINLVFKSDVISAIQFVIENELNGIYNVVAPSYPNRGEYYNEVYLKLNQKKSLTLVKENPCNRIISSNKLIQMGFEFKFPNPLKFPLTY